MTVAAVSSPGAEAQVGTNANLPGTGMSMSTDHFYWFNGTGPVPSVTKILSIVDKGYGLLAWGKRTVADTAITYAEHLPQIIDAIGPSEAARWLASLPDQEKGAAAKRGTDLHRYADMAARGVQIDSKGLALPPEYIPYLDAFSGYLARYGASSIVSSEKAIWSDDGYAGTYDLLQLIDNELWLIDIKTSKGIYPEFRLQLAGYGFADAIILPDDPNRYPMPEIKRYGILHLRPDLYTDTGYRLVEQVVGEREYVAFLAAKNLYDWREVAGKK